MIIEKESAVANVILEPHGEPPKLKPSWHGTRRWVSGR